MNIGFYYNKIYFYKSLKYKEQSQSQGRDVSSREKWLLGKMKEINDELTVKRNYGELKDSLFLKGTSFDLKTEYPGLATGTGMGHEADVKGELKLGFYFDYTTGQPVIPGSTIKGVLRSAFPQWDGHKKTSEKKKLAKTAYIYMLLERKGNEKWDELRKKWDALDDDEIIKQKKRITTIEKEIFEGVVNGENIPVYQRDIFHDAYISAGTTLNPAKDRILGVDSITPHVQEGMSYEASMLKNPTPISFLKVLPDVRFSFHFILNDHSSNHSDLLNSDKKKDLFKQILLDFGIGAKTNVGYGQFSAD